MLLKIKNLLTEEECERLVALAGDLKFVDGRVSNPANTSKQNLQADPSDPKYAESVQIVGSAFPRSREFGSFALPRRIAPPLLCRYEPGMKYGAHADAAIIQLPNIEDPIGSLLHRLHRRSGSLRGRRARHGPRKPDARLQGRAGRGRRLPFDPAARGRARRSGQRLVSITFIESHVADQHERMQVYELNEIASIEGLRMNPESRVRLDVVRQNLLRMWSST